MDEDLRRAFRRVEPPAGFADRVLKAARLSQPAASASARASADEPARQARTSAISQWAVAATLVAALGGSVWYRAEEKRKEGEDAKRQVLFSLGLAGSKLRSIEMKVNHGEER